jgi:hypothetical protein
MSMAGTMRPVRRWYVRLATADGGEIDFRTSHPRVGSVEDAIRDAHRFHAENSIRSHPLGSLSVLEARELPLFVPGSL